MAKYRTLTVGQLEQSKGTEIWVLNSTSQKQRAEVHFAVPKSNGDGLDAIIVPETFVAVCLTEQASREQILRAADFRNTVRKGFITIISPEDAAKINSRIGAKTELSRIRKESMLAEAGLQGEGVGTIEVPDNIEITNGKRKASKNGDPIRPLIAQITDTLKKQAELEVINTLRNVNNKKAVNAEEYQSILSAATKHKKKKVAAFCKNRLEALSTAAEAKTAKREGVKKKKKVR